MFFDEGFADLAERRPITPDSLFNVASLRKPFEAALLALAVQQGKMALDDPISTYLPALSDGDDIRRVTVGQLATHTSGLLLPHDHPPWPTTRYTPASFIKALNRSIRTPATSCSSSRSSAGWTLPSATSPSKSSSSPSA